MIIRRAKKSDLKILAGVMAADPFFKSYGVTPTTAKKVLAKNLTDTLVATENNTANKTPLGFVVVVPKAGLARASYIRLIAVAVKKAGVGKALMKAAEKKSPNGILLLVTSTNTTAQKFYRKIGFVKVGSISGFVKPGVRELIFFKG